jgi:hypothetical protein
MGRRLLDAWRRYWFTPASLTNLGIARILLAAILLWLDGTTRFLGVSAMLPAFWTPIPLLRLLGFGQPGARLLEWLSSVNVALLCALGLGVFTRTALALLFPLQLYLESLLNCFGKVSHGTIPDIYALFFLLLAPCDRGFALGAIWRRARAAGAAPVAAPSRLSPFAGWPFDLLFVELAAYYCLSGLSKLRDGGLGWADGYALQYYLLLMRMPGGMWLASHLWLCTALSVLVLAFELGAPIGILRRWRPFVLGGGLLFHLSTWYFMNIWFWPIVALYAFFVPWTRLGTAVARVTGFARGSLRVAYDGSCSPCRRTVSVLRDLDLAGKLAFVAVPPPARGGHLAGGHLVVGPRGDIDGLRRLAWALPAAWPLAPLLYVPGAPWLGRHLWSAVVRLRAAASS